MRRRKARRVPIGEPQLLEHKIRGVAYGYALFAGERRSYGRLDDEARRLFDADRRTWLDNGGNWPTQPEPAAPAPTLTIRDMVANFRAHLQQLRPAKWHANNSNRLGRAFCTLLDRHGHMPARDYGPKLLQEIRQTMLATGKLCRETINTHVGYIKAAFRWAGKEELIPGTVAESVLLVDGLKAGDYDVREGKGHRDAVDADVVAATLPHLHPIAAAMVQLLHLTGCRPSELFSMTPAMIDRTTDVWACEITEHKTKRHGHRRFLFLGPQAQELLRPLLDRVPLPPQQRPLFNPQQTVAPANREGRESRKIGDRYSAGALRVAVTRAVRRANVARAAAIYAADPTAGDLVLAQIKVATITDLRGKRLAEFIRRRDGEPVPSWSPYMLRHRRLTDVRRQFGAEAAAAVGGHSMGKDAKITEGYTSTAAWALARDVMRQVG